MLGNWKIGKSLIVYVSPRRMNYGLFLLDLQFGHVVAVQGLHVPFVFQHGHFQAENIQNVPLDVV